MGKADLSHDTLSIPKLHILDEDAWCPEGLPKVATQITAKPFQVITVEQRLAQYDSSINHNYPLIESLSLGGYDNIGRCPKLPAKHEMEERHPQPDRAACHNLSNLHEVIATDARSSPLELHSESNVMTD